MNSIIILDMSYTLSMYRKRQLHKALESRKLSGYFTNVISVHPLAALFESGPTRFGKPEITKLDDQHTFVEGKIGISNGLRYLSWLNFLFAQISLVGLLVKMSKETGVRVVRIGDPYYLGLLGLYLSWSLKAPLVIRVCSDYDETYRLTGRSAMPRLFKFRWIEKLIERFVFKRCDLIAGANEANMNYALENGGRRNVATIFRYGNLIHESHWKDPAARTGADEHLSRLGIGGDKFIATITRLEPVKRVKDVILLTSELIKCGNDIKCLIIGDGTLRSELEYMAKNIGIADKVVFAGNRPQEWIASILPKASIIVSPQMGRGLAEAALAGVPIVAYDYDWQKELVLDGDTGCLVADGDWHNMSKKVQSLLSDPVLAKKMGQNIRSKIMDMMDPEKLENHERDEYIKLCDRVSF